MILYPVHKEDFYRNLFELNKIPIAYDELFFEFNNVSNISNKSYTKYVLPSTQKIHSFQLVPNYLKTEIKEGLTQKKIFQKYGYAANLMECNSIEDYIKTNFKSSFRNNVKRSIKRLEASFDINYKMFYGDIVFEEYTSLMTSFHEMLSKRFQQLNVRNISLENWEHYLKIAFDRINNKEASLFVIYKNQEPIAYSLNFHFDEIFYFAIPTFNLDFSKFTLGNVVIYKNLEWSFNNEFKMFDMGYGGFENKINWCNTTYNFEHCLLFSSKNVLGYLYAAILKHKYQLINYLLRKNINTTYRNFKNFVLRKKKLEVLDYRILPNESIANDSYLINFNDDRYNYLKKPIYDFLYSNNEHINNVQVFALNKEKNYIIKGTKNQIKIEID